jgi:hypothetical protein
MSVEYPRCQAMAMADGHDLSQFTLILHNNHVVSCHMTLISASYISSLLKVTKWHAYGACTQHSPVMIIA